MPRRRGEKKNEEATASAVVGRQVKVAREWLRLTQADLARRLTERGRLTHQATIARLENGDRAVTVDDVFAIAATLGVSPLWLLSGSYTHESVPVLDELAPKEVAMRHWLRGEVALPGTDELAFVEVVPNDARLARQLRGLENMQDALRDYVDARHTKDPDAATDALSDLAREIARQKQELEREERLARKEKDNG